MKKFALVAVLAVCVSWLGATLAQAQQFPGGVQRRPSTIALLDVSYVFKNHARFKAMMTEMKADVERAESQVKKERDSILALAERSKEFRPGTPDYKAVEEDLTKRQADLSVRVQLQKKEFLQREAKIYYTVYQEIFQETNEYMNANGLDMVLRFNGDPVDVEKPDDVLRDINKPVICYAKDRDITPIILENLNRRAGNAFGGTTPAANGRNPAGVPFPQYK